MSDILNINETSPLIKQHSGCDFHRMTLPFLQMGFNFKEAHKKTNLRDFVKDSKLVLSNREPGVDLQELYNLRKEFGFKLVIDMDDYHVLPKSHQLYAIWNGNGYIKLLEDLFREADALTTTTPRLAEKLKTINSNVFVIPNAVPFLNEGQWSFQENKQYDGKFKYFSEKGQILPSIPETRFAWSGGSTHLKDIQSIAPVFEEFPTLPFKLCGYDNPYAKHGHINVWDQMESIVSLNGSNPNYRRSGTKSLWHYMEHLNDVDVAIAPLEPIPWNTYKSSLKAYEAGVKKCAFICSDMAPYADDIPADCATFCRTTEQWMDAVEMHEDLDYVKMKAEKLHNWVRENRDLKIVSAYRLKIYDHISKGGKSHEIPSYDYLLNYHNKIESHEPEQISTAA